MNTNFNNIIEMALSEDLNNPYYDATTDHLFQNQLIFSKVKIISKHSTDITICGLELIKTLFCKLDPNCEFDTNYLDGDMLSQGEILLTITGDCRALLKGERTALNFLRHLSAIATLTQRFVNKVKHTPLKILDTRKTMPGLRFLEKYAVACGGGVNHRMGLYDAIMIKDTHIDLLGDIETALEKIPDKNCNNLPVIVEVRNFIELEATIKYGQGKVTRVLLDNMSYDEMSHCVETCRGIFETEASGNITLENIVKIAETGVDYASVGMLTHSAGTVDLSMQTMSVMSVTAGV